MFTVIDLDNRHRRVSTGSEKLARQYWAAVLQAGGTPAALLWKRGETQAVKLEPVA